MAQNESIIQTRQQHCSSLWGIVFKTKIVNAIAFVCSAGETHQKTALNGVFGEN